MNIVIIGGGICGVYVANKLLKKDSNYNITILSKEKYKPYDRIHLCSLFNEETKIDDITLKLKKKVNLQLEEEVTDIFPSSKSVITRNHSYKYDKLIIATGSNPNSPFNLAAIENACTFRSVDDALFIKNNIENKNVVLVGVGPIGLELLDTLSKWDKANSVHILSRGDHLYSKDIDNSGIKLMNDIFESNPKIKVSFRDEIVDKTIENNYITKIKTKKREIENPFIVFGTGISPNIDFARASLETQKGILVDEHMQSSNKDIYVVGEAAQVRSDGFIAGRVKECTNQCDVAISHIIGKDVSFKHYASIDSLKVGSFLLADVTSVNYEANNIDNETFIISSKKDKRLDQYIINNNKLVRFIGINTNIDILHLQEIIKENKDIDANYFYNNRLLSQKGRLICSCIPTHESELIDIIKENAVCSFSELSSYSKVGKVCGRCKHDIVNLINSTDVDKELAKKLKEEKENKKVEKELKKVKSRIDKYNKLHPANELDESNLKAALESFDKTKDFNAWLSMITARMNLHPKFESTVEKGIKQLNKIPVIWLELSDCTGNSESFIKTANPTVEELILDYISLDYHELLMTSSSHQSETVLDEIIKNDKGKYILLVEGAVPLGMDGKFLRIGPKGETGIDLLKRCAKDAAAIISVGSCAFDGGVVAANTNPTGAVGVAEALNRKDVINLPGCPTNPINIVGTILHYLMFEEFPKLDDKNRPLWAYQHRIHDNCERRGHYDNDEFVLQWGDEGAKQGWCLFKMGCKGPYANLNCSLVKFNEGTSWPVQSGHGCFGCGQGKIAFDTYATQRPLENVEQNTSED